MQNAVNMTSDRLGRIVEDALSEVYVFSAQDFTFSLVNRGARENLGFTMEELRAKTPWDLKPTLSRQEFLDLVDPIPCSKGFAPAWNSRRFTKGKMARATTSGSICS